MSFVTSTRRKMIPLPQLTQASGNPVQWDVPKTGILGGVFLSVSATLAGIPVTPDPLGAQKIVKKVRLIANSGIDLINISGTTYNSMLRHYTDTYLDPVPQSQATSALAAGTFNLDMYLPVSINRRDPIGLFMLQNEQTLLTLVVEFEAVGNLAASGFTTLSYTIQPWLEVYTVPVDPKDWPDFSVVHQIIEDSRPVSGAGDYEYYWPRGNTYLQVLHGAGLAQSGSDNWTRARLRINQSDFLVDMLPGTANIEYGLSHGTTRMLGLVPFDLMGTSSLGMLGSSRDMLYSAAVTDLASVITFGAAGTLWTLRRQLISLQG